MVILDLDLCLSRIPDPDPIHCDISQFLLLHKYYNVSQKQAIPKNGKNKYDIQFSSLPFSMGQSYIRLLEQFRGKELQKVSGSPFPEGK
jgi:hypothetical protein